MVNMANQNILIKKLYNSLIKDNKVNISPLTYISEYDENKNEIRIFISNPKNITYNTYVIEELFHNNIVFI